MRALFAKKLKQNGGRQNEVQNSPNLSGPLSKILALPMPKILDDSEYDQMDIFTAASLNSKYIQHFIGPIENISPSTSEPQSTSQFQLDKATVEMTINTLNVHKWSPLMYASYLGHKDMAQLLLERGGNPGIRNENGQTTLMMAASCGSTEVVNILLQYSAKINVQDKYGRSPLHYAVKYNQSKITSILLEKGADPNLVDCENMTPTLMACEIGNEVTVNDLIQNNGDPNRQNKHGDTGFTLATEHPKVLALLQKLNIKQIKKEKITQNSTNFNRQKVDFVSQLLSELELTKYLKNFQDNNITTEADFANLTEEKLAAIGITLFGPKKKILTALSQYSKVESLTCNSTKTNSSLAANNNTISTPALDIEQIEACLGESRQETTHYKQLFNIHSQLLRENQNLNIQIYSLLKQIISSNEIKFDEQFLESIESVIKQIEQLNLKLNNVIV